MRQGIRVGGLSGRLTPRFCVVPMGWSHASDVAQGYFGALVATALGLRETQLLHDGAAPRPLHQGIAAVYVDNFVYVSSDAESSHRAVARVRDECSRRGLPFHEDFSGEVEAEALGWRFNGVSKQIVPTARHAWRLHGALSVVLQSPRLRSDQLQVLVGHFTFLALLGRPLLATMQAVYAFCLKGYRRPQPLWDSVLRELRWMRDLIPLCFADLARPATPLVAATDASLDAQGDVSPRSPALSLTRCVGSEKCGFSATPRSVISEPGPGCLRS